METVSFRSNSLDEFFAAMGGKHDPSKLKTHTCAGCGKEFKGSLSSALIAEGIMSEFNLPTAVRAFHERKLQNKGKEKINALLPAGSDMYFYCRYCYVQTDRLPETYIGTPKTCCDDCKKLAEHGAMP